MPPRVVGAGDARVLDLACEALEGGGLIVYPTDTLYALGAKVGDAHAAECVRRLKGRPDNRPLPVIAGSWDQVAPLAQALPPRVRALAGRFWPGPLTLVLPAAASVPEALTCGTGTLAVRIPGLALARQLCERAGPLIATSANLHGAPAPATCAEALADIGGGVALAVDGGRTGGGVASTIVDLTGDLPRLLRVGAIRWEDVLETLSQHQPR